MSAYAMGQRQPCPHCGASDGVRWRGRRPWDFAFTWMRWWVELIASLVSPPGRQPVLWEDQNREEFRAEMLEAKTGHKTPKRFWRCASCKQEGHVF
jgi:hypothetical protein